MTNLQRIAQEAEEAEKSGVHRTDKALELIARLAREVERRWKQEHAEASEAHDD